MSGRTKGRQQPLSRPLPVPMGLVESARLSGGRPGRSLQRRIDRGQRLFVLDVADLRYAEGAAQLVGSEVLNWAGRLGLARFRLRKCGRTGGMEGHLALDLLQDLVDMAVEHGDGA